MRKISIDIEWNDLQEPIIDFAKRIIDEISKGEALYLYKNRGMNTLVIVDIDGCNYFSEPKTLSMLINSRINFRRVRYHDDKPKYFPYEMVSERVCALILESDICLLDLERINLFSNFPVLRDNQIISDHGYSSEHKIYYHGPELEEVNGLTYTKKLLESFEVFPNVVDDLKSA